MLNILIVSTDRITRNYNDASKQPSIPQCIINRFGEELLVVFISLAFEVLLIRLGGADSHSTCSIREGKGQEKASMSAETVCLNLIRFDVSLSPKRCQIMLWSR